MTLSTASHANQKKWGMGYLNNPFPGPTEKALRIHTLDARIHFALHCRAGSCPPVAFYSPEKIEAQLEIATNNYLSGEIRFVENENKVYHPAIMSWCRGDFWDKKGMRKLLQKHGYSTINTSTKMTCSPYD